MMKKHLMVLVLAATLAAAVVLPAAGPAAAQPQPTMVIVPSSGPCDGTVEVSGSLSLDESEFLFLRLYLVQPGTADISMDILNDGMAHVYGKFGDSAPLWRRGCEAAALDSQSQQPRGHLSLALSVKGGAMQPGVQPGESIPNIIAVAEYAYTTTAPQPRPTMVLSPASGACDATVQVTGSAFQPGQEVSLGLKPPGFDEPLGTLASTVADARGEFVVPITLGDLGCRAAQICIRSRDATQPQLGIVADSIPPPQQIGASLATVLYTFTTTEVGGIPLPRSLPATGTGPAGGAAPAPWGPLIGGVAALGVILLAASLYGRRLRS